MAPGSYLLEMTGGTRPSRHCACPWSWCRGSCPFAPPGFKGCRRQGEVGNGPSPSPRPAGRWALVERALATYHLAFDSWFAGRPGDAPRRARHFEAGRPPSPTASPCLSRRARSAHAAKLVTVDEEALVPLMCLHGLLYHFYGPYDPRFATHSQRLAGRVCAALCRPRRPRHRPDRRPGPGQPGRRPRQEAAPATPPRSPSSAPSARSSTAGGAAGPGRAARVVWPLRHRRRAAAAARPHGGAVAAAAIQLAVNLGRVGSIPSGARPAGRAGGRPAGVDLTARLQEQARLLAGTQRADEALPVLVEARSATPRTRRSSSEQGRAARPAAASRCAGQRVLAAIDDLTARPRRLSPACAAAPCRHGRSRRRGAVWRGQRSSACRACWTRPGHSTGARREAGKGTGCIAHRDPPGDGRRGRDAAGRGDGPRLFDKPDRTKPAFGSVEVVASVGLRRAGRAGGPLCRRHRRGGARGAGLQRDDRRGYRESPPPLRGRRPHRLRRHRQHVSVTTPPDTASTKR